VKLLVRPAAREDILRQYEYYLIEKDAEHAAERFLDEVQAAIGSVLKHPEAGAPKRFENPLLRGLRSWPVKGFPAMRVYYLIAKDTIRIVRVLHGNRDVASLLENEGDLD
jgi:toxin ParE1/3/4